MFGRSQDSRQDLHLVPRGDPFSSVRGRQQGALASLDAGVHPEAQERVNEGQPAIADWPSPYGPAIEYNAVQHMELDSVQSVTRASGGTLVEGRDLGFD